MLCMVLVFSFLSEVMESLTLTSMLLVSYIVISMSSELFLWQVFVLSSYTAFQSGVTYSQQP